MPKKISKTGSELFIVDNSDDDWKVLRYLHDWCQTLQGHRHGHRLLRDRRPAGPEGRMAEGRPDPHPHGRRGLADAPKAAFEQGLQQRHSRGSTPAWKPRRRRTTSSTASQPSWRRMRSGKIQCRVYRKDKFHAKAYITHARQEVVGSFALVGSSNFTYPGLTENIELNVQITGTPVERAPGVVRGTLGRGRGRHPRNTPGHRAAHPRVHAVRGLC